MSAATASRRLAAHNGGRASFPMLMKRNVLLQISVQVAKASQGAMPGEGARGVSMSR